MHEQRAGPDDAFSLAQVTVEDCRPEQFGAFRDLNLAWIERWFEIEDKDRATLDDPQRGILDRGGVILVAVWHPARGGPSHVVATTALLRDEQPGVFQLAKMAVAEPFQGRQLGKLIGTAAIERARQLGASAVRLESNSRLTPALRLYEKLGFEHQPRRQSPYTRADVQMILQL